MDLHYLTDRLEIDDLITRYVVAVDSKTHDLLDSVFTPDAFIDYSDASGVKGHYPEMRKWIEDVVSPYPMTQHIVVNRQVDLDGDAARVRCYVFNPMGFPDAEGGLTLFFVGGYYNDRCVRTPDGWRIAERTYENAWLAGTVPQEALQTNRR